MPRESVRAAGRIFPENYRDQKEREIMTDLSRAENTIEVLKKYHFQFDKKLGQNFLIDPHVLQKIIGAADITKDDCVLEVGPGIGTMTQALSRAAGKVVAVEVDGSLIPILADTLSGCDNVKVIHQDILKTDLNRLVQEENAGKPVKVVANLPYYITTPIIMGLFERHVPAASITVMVQKEVAERMQSGPGSKNYGALSLAVQYYAEPYLAANVPPNCFMPRPNVASAVIRLTLHDRPPVFVQDEALMFALIRAAFGQRRKTLVNALHNAAIFPLDKEQIGDVLASAGLRENVRGETLTLAQFAALANAFSERCR